ncbi:MAG: hypothetical protein AB7I27_11720 [Bacteriovoracaceae bacterium]
MIKNILLLFLLLSCGKQHKEKKFPIKEAQTVEGNYAGEFLSINEKVADQIDGKILVSRVGDLFEAKLKIRNLPKGEHRQYFYSGISCPSIIDDKNFDGYVDAIEMQNSAGNRILPLDNDLTRIGTTTDFFPSGSFYKYSQSASYSQMLSDLNERDDLLLDGIIVIIFGAAEEFLPNTVSRIDDLNSQKSLPVACAILRQQLQDSPHDNESDEWESNGVPHSTPGPSTTVRRHPRHPRTGPSNPPPSFPPPSDEEVKPTNSGGLLRRIGRWIRGWFGHGPRSDDSKPKE